MPAMLSVKMVFDSHISQIRDTDNYNIVWTSSGETQVTAPGASYSKTFEVTLEDGYVLDSVTADKTSVEEVTDTTFTIAYTFTTTVTVTLTSKSVGGSTMTKQVDLTTLTGWANLSDGEHTITIKAKADGYRDSQASTGVSVTKGGGVTPAIISFSIGGTTYQAEEGMTWSEWCASKYNTDGYYVDDSEVYRRVDSDNLYRVVVGAGETIIANYTYREKMA